MIFKPFAIINSQQIKFVQDIINEGLGIYQGFCELGGNVFDSEEKSLQSHFLIAKRLHEENSDISEARRLVLTQRKKRDFKDILQLGKDLSNKEAWENLQSSHKAWTTEIDVLRKQWMRQAEFFHFTVDGLLSTDELIKNILTFVHKANQLVQKDKYKFRPGLNIDVYKHYLVEIEEGLINERHKIAEALFYRFRVCLTEKSLETRLPLLSLLNQLEALGIRDFKPYENNTFLQTKDIRFPIAYAYDYIMKHGSDDLKALVRPKFNLTGFDGKIILLRVCYQEKQCYLIPDTLKDFVPSKWSFWRHIIPGYKARFNFIRDKTPLLFQLMAEKNASIRNTTWENLEALQNSLEEAVSNSEEKKHRWPGFLFKKHNRLFDRWQKLALQQSREFTRKQIDYLDDAMHHKPHHISMLLSKCNAEDNVASFLLTLEKRMQKLGFSEEEMHSFYLTKQKILQKNDLSFTEASKRKEQSLSQKLFLFTNNNKPLNNEDFNRACTEIDLINREQTNYSEYWPINHIDTYKLLINNIQGRIDFLIFDICERERLREFSQYMIQASKWFSLVQSHSEFTQELPRLSKSLEVFLDSLLSHVKSLSKEEVLEQKTGLNEMISAIRLMLSLGKEMEKYKEKITKVSISLLDIEVLGKSIDISEVERSVKELLAESRRDRQRSIMLFSDKRKHARARELEELEKKLEALDLGSMDLDSDMDQIEINRVI